jgi:hypothetical protein
MESIVPILALVVSVGSLTVSMLSFRVARETQRRALAEKSVNAWITLTRLGSEWFQATLHLKNKSHLDISIEKLSVDLPDYRLGIPAQAKEIKAADGTVTNIDVSGVDHCLAMPFKFNVAAGESLEENFLIHQPAHSQRKRASINMFYWTLEPKRRWCSLTLPAQTRNDW